MEQNSWGRPLHDRTELRRVLSLVLDLLNPDASGLEYRLVGTGAALAQGVQLPTGDIDILVTRRDEVDTFAAALSGFPCLEPPASLPRPGSTSPTSTSMGSTWAPAPSRCRRTPRRLSASGGPWQHYLRVDLGKHTVPAVALELRLVSELIRNRPDRYIPLIEYMRSHGADLQLVQKSMNDRGVDPMLQQQTLDQLQTESASGE
jgi:hypothetical protein